MVVLRLGNVLYCRSLHCQCTATFVGSEAKFQFSAECILQTARQRTVVWGGKVLRKTRKVIYFARIQVTLRHSLPRQKCCRCPKLRTTKSQTGGTYRPGTADSYIQADWPHVALCCRFKHQFPAMFRTLKRTPELYRREAGGLMMIVRALCSEC